MRLMSNQPPSFFCHSKIAWSEFPEFRIRLGKECTRSAQLHLVSINQRSAYLRMMRYQILNGACKKIPLYHLPTLATRGELFPTYVSECVCGCTYVRTHLRSVVGCGAHQDPRGDVLVIQGDRVG